jgi:hypothetical protein
MSNRAVYITPDHNEPSGGIRAIYRHVELLTAAGVDAAVWHCADGFSCDWFTSSAPVVTGAELELDDSDVLVVPEVLVIAGSDPAPGCRKVIYNQNHFYTFDNTGDSGYPGWSSLAAVWVSSTTSAEVLRRLLEVDVAVIPYSIDLDLFRPAEKRKRKVVWMPRKRPREAALLHALLAADARFADVELTAVDGLSEQETAAELSDAAVLIALGHEEGFGLPVAEALACGCAVVGYAAGGGAELFTAPGTHEITDADLLGMVEKVAEVLEAAPDEDERLAYRAHVEAHYSATAQLDRLTTALKGASASPGEGGTARHPSAPPAETGPTAEELLRGEAESLRGRIAGEEAARQRAERIAGTLEADAERLHREHDKARRRVNLLTEELRDLRAEHKELRGAAERLAHFDEVTAMLAVYKRDNDRLNARLDAEIRHLTATMDEQMADMRNSTSWKVTAPLRKVSDRLRGSDRG